ncbi:DNA gyrase subunit B, partial [Desulfococcaceae bacterium OttesenSCG-928-F15]|nr:DNA gyrase subunit B [Desulfococcaceae bacterium OttesenSCG-928-F15]
KNIITVLGAGIGREEFDIEKIRYHKIVIMTDADVDGSHIRTLLLTFFYRHVPEVIQNGYLYIAQPPLYRVGKGKGGVYLKDETEYNRYLLKRFCELKEIYVGDEERPVNAESLFNHLEKLSIFIKNQEKLKRRGYEPELLNLLLSEGIREKDSLKNTETMEKLKDTLLSSGYEIKLFSWNEEKDQYNLMVTPPEIRMSHDETETLVREKKPISIGRSFIFSAEYQQCAQILDELKYFNQPPFRVKAKEGSEVETFDNFRTLFKKIEEEAKKGISIQRYKGLGEMNPDQLWETTMDPSVRRLLCVKIDDALVADDVFTLLMGDEVEPRREFIQSNALEVSMIDI